MSEDPRVCTKCRRALPLSEYKAWKWGRGGYHPNCRECFNASLRARPKDHPTRVRERERRKEWGPDHPNRIRERAYGKKKYQQRKEKHLRAAKIAKFKKKYGITPDQAAQMLVAQGGVCAICKTNEWTAAGPSVDHCHATGTVRGILCNRCNAAIGFFREDVVRMRSAIDYLAKPDLAREVSFYLPDCFP